MKTTQIVPGTLYLSSVFTFLVNYVEYSHMHRITMYCDIIVLRPVHRDVYRIAKFLPVPSPILKCTFLADCDHNL